MIFSRRTAWDLRPNAIALRLAERRREGRPPRFDLTETNPTRCGLGWDERALSTALDVGGIERYDPEPQGLRVARAAIAAHHRANGLYCHTDALFLTASTSEAYAWLWKLLADPGDAILVPAPGYPLFEYLAGLESVAVETYPLRHSDGFWLDAGEVERCIDATERRVAAIVVVNPGNPTGAYLSPEETASLTTLAEERGIPIVADEVFRDYPLTEGRRVSLFGAQAGLVFGLDGISKSLALPQLKLAWIHVSGQPERVSEARRRLEVIADTWLSAATPVQLAAPALLARATEIQQPILERVRGNLATLRASAASAGVVSVLPVQGGWSAVLRTPGIRTDEEDVLDLLDREDVLVQPGWFYDFDTPGFRVLSLLPEPDRFAEGVDRLMIWVGSR